MVSERVIQAIKKVVERDDITIDTTFSELGVDSLDGMEILFEVEEEFDIKIPNDAARHINSVRDVVTGVEKLLAGETIEIPADKAPADPAPADSAPTESMPTQSPGTE